MSWNGRELGGIQETAAADAIHCQKVSELRGAETQADVAAGCAEGAVGGVDIAEQLARRPRPERVVMFATRLVLSPNSALGRSGDELHALNRAGWELRGEDLALLIADWLPSITKLTCAWSPRDERSRFRRPLRRRCCRRSPGSAAAGSIAGSFIIRAVRSAST